MTTIAPPPERWEAATIVIEWPRTKKPRHRHDETIETWKYVVVIGGFSALWLGLLIGGAFAVKTAAHGLGLL